ncbi:small GTP-binding protein [Histomonas meleagridis]|uniref:small GTP-binding protein n=1 Tax=Histomonas meleagridis TaxID=135588 RepID=UPI00355A4739|nr:small GTP-binding protein [Histomonas meleagridis]KAH0800220.1 small GTP-binding protein [Histomonas meleagridis]
MLGNSEFIIKIIVLGDSGVGKTSFLVRFFQDEYRDSLRPTEGVEFFSKELTIKNQRANLQIWDTSGQEVFLALTRSYFRNSLGALILFDLTSVDSLNNTEKWINEIKEVEGSDVTLVLIGNKSDLERKVSKEEAENYARTKNMTYFEASAKTGENVSQAIDSCIMQIQKKIEEGKIDPYKKDIPKPMEDKRCKC